MVSAAPPDGQNLWFAFRAFARFQPIVGRLRCTSPIYRLLRAVATMDRKVTVGQAENPKFITMEPQGEGSAQGLSTFAYSVACRHTEQDVTLGCSCFKESLDPVLL